jgi:hypothetical protein
MSRSIAGTAACRYDVRMQTKLAELALHLANVAPIKGADAEGVVAVKQWLKQIVNGQLTVIPKPPEAPQ